MQIFKIEARIDASDFLGNNYIVQTMGLKAENEPQALELARCYLTRMLDAEVFWDITTINGRKVPSFPSFRYCEPEKQRMRETLLRDVGEQVTDISVHAGSHFHRTLLSLG